MNILTVKGLLDDRNKDAPLIRPLRCAFYFYNKSLRSLSILLLREFPNQEIMEYVYIKNLKVVNNATFQVLI